MFSSVLENKPTTQEMALSILNADSCKIPDLLYVSNTLRVRQFGNTVNLCSIVNAKSGACQEDCAFCAQSAHHSTHAEKYNLLTPEKLCAAYKDSSLQPIDHFGVVTSGDGLGESDVETICKAMSIGEINNVHWCTSLGILDMKQLSDLKQAGLKRFHHNLETSESYFSRICTSHSYAERLEMVQKVKQAGLQICCGGIMGLGETLEQRVEFAFALRNEQVDSIPLNFHVPVKGTKLESLKPMNPLEIIKCIAMFRIVNPTAEIKVAAGRLHLRDLQSMIFYAGATGMMIGPLLTIAGRNVDHDLQMLEDLGVDSNKSCH